MKVSSYNFTKLCKMSQENLKKYVAGGLSRTHQKVIIGDGYVFAQGEFPVCLVAHLDTVHDDLPTIIRNEKGRLSSPQGIGGDDRCGVYMILEIVKRINCSVLFCEDEELGCVGASKFIKSKVAQGLEFNYMIELDRRGSNDAVFYECDNPDFTDFILSMGYWKEAEGSFTDISVLAPYFGCAAVNFSCGYYNAHTVKENVVLDEMGENIDAVIDLLSNTTTADKFKYIERVYKGFSCENYHITNYDDPFVVEFSTEEGDYGYEEVWAMSKDEAIGRFLMEYSRLRYTDIIDVYYLDDLYEDVEVTK